MSKLSPAAKLAAIVDELGKLTFKNEVEWQETTWEEGFQLPFPDQTVIIRRGARTGTSFIEIQNAAGKVVESASSSQLEREVPQSEQKLDALLELARRQVYEVDKELDSLLARLVSRSSKSQ